MPVRTLLIFVCFLTLPSVSHAHGAGITFSATSTAENGEMRLVDVDYSDFTIYADTIGRFDFKLFSDAERTKAVPFTDLWVRIEEKREAGRGRVLFAGPIAKMEFGGTGFSTVFPRDGEYVLNVRYNDSGGDEFGTTVAEAEFTLDVLPDPHGEPRYRTPAFWAGFFSALVVALVAAGAVFVRSKFS